MRLGRISFTTDYVVDLDNKAMVVHAMTAIQEDLLAAFKGDSIEDYVLIKEDSSLSADMICEFLLDEEEE